MNAVTFRSLTRADYPLLARWFSEPGVSRWWNEDPSFDAIEEKYGPRVDGEDRTTMWVVEIDGAPAGLMQHYRHDDYPEHDVAVGIADAVGIDFLLSDEFAGRGLRPEVLSRFPTRSRADLRSDLLRGHPGAGEPAVMAGPGEGQIRAERTLPPAR